MKAEYRICFVAAHVSFVRNENPNWDEPLIGFTVGAERSNISPGPLLCVCVCVCPYTWLLGGGVVFLGTTYTPGAPVEPLNAATVQ